MKIDPLADAKIKIERANLHIGDAQAQIVEFFSAPPPHYEVFREISEDESRESIKVRIIREPPSQVAAAIGDAITNLRSALDFLVCELAIKNGRNDLDGVEFPFANSLDEFQLRRTQRKIDKLSDEAIGLINGLQPYRGGNDALWSMNALRRPNIHRHLIVSMLSFGFTDGRVHFMPLKAGRHSIGGTDPWRASDREVTVFNLPPSSVVEFDLKVGLDITISDVEPHEGHPVSFVLGKFSDLTARILKDF